MHTNINNGVICDLLVEESSASHLEVINNMIIPKVSAYWNMVLYQLEYDIAFKKELEKKYKGDPRQCCTALLKDWITSSRGVVPKTITKLLEIFGQLPEIVSVVAEIKQLLGEEGNAKTCMFFMHAMYYVLLLYSYYVLLLYSYSTTCCGLDE